MMTKCSANGGDLHANGGELHDISTQYHSRALKEAEAEAEKKKPNLCWRYPYYVEAKQNYHFM